MLVKEFSCLFGLLLAWHAWLVPTVVADDFDAFLQPLLTQHCVRCHGGDEVNGKVNLREIANSAQLLTRPQLIEDVIEVIDFNEMPPADEPALDDPTRLRLIAHLKGLLREATASQTPPRTAVWRLNRFQYNNVLKDLFQLDRDVFALPEKLMTRHSNYVAAGARTMPDQVQVASHALQPAAGFEGVKPFPKDLRAAHGFDNQSNQLNLSPLLLDAFLRLSISILESPDFQPQHVGIWNEFFQEPVGVEDQAAEIKRRLTPFLRRAFRGPVEEATLERYVAYGTAKLASGLSFTESMKKVTSAILSSPIFLFRVGPPAAEQDPYALAAKLSFLLWSSCPDDELLRLAETGELAEPEHLNRTIERMLADPKIERFLDTFPSQWMQLENALAATPDPSQARLFSLDENRPASLQMVLEPLLLFDTVFLEDRPLVELIAPNFSYQSDFLKTWYTTDLQPPPIPAEEIVAQNQRNDVERARLQALIDTNQAELDALIEPIRARILAARKQELDDRQPVDLEPYSAWEFNGDLEDAVHGLHLKSHGEVEFKDGQVVLKQAYLLSEKIPFDLKAKTLEVWCHVHNLDKPGGGVMGIQGPGDFFDTIVIGERQPRHWISGSNGFSRTEDFPGSTPETKVDEMLHLVMVYAADGTTTLYRDGQPYGGPYRKGEAVFPKDRSFVLFGLRHLPPGPSKYLDVSLDMARLYDRALTPEEVAESASGNHLYVGGKALREAMTAGQKQTREVLEQALDTSQAALKAVPANRDLAQVRQEFQRRFDNQLVNQMRSQSFARVAAEDPRYGGVITNAAVATMTSGPQRTHPIARGAWVIEVIFNDPPPPPPNDVPPLSEEDNWEDLTIREQFAVHRENPSCAGCHSRLDPLGFALENFDITGRWRDQYANGRDVDSSGKLMKKYEFDGIVRFKETLVQEQRRFAKAFTAHLLRFALSRELRPVDSLAIDSIVEKTEPDEFKLRSVLREVILSDCFLQAN